VFNAHFPYLAGSAKRAEHGKALMIPRLAEDTEKEYRECVSTAGFFLMRAGERVSIEEQLQDPFGGRSVLKDEFRNVYVRIVDIEEEERAWVAGFLDWILNPNIALTVAGWFHFVEEILLEELQDSLTRRTGTDIYRQGLCCDGRFLRDQGKAAVCAGTLLCDGSWKCEDFQPARGTLYDTVCAPVFPDGAYRGDGSFDCSGYIRIYDPKTFTVPIMPTDGAEDTLVFESGPLCFEDGMRHAPLCDGSWMCDGSNLAPMVDTPMKLRLITPVRCDGMRTPSCSACDGTWTCDGSHDCFDGWYCSGDLIEEEVV
jgi:hypothetical protein